MSAVAPLPATTLAAATAPGIGQRLAGLSRAAQLRLAIGVVLIVGVAIAGITMGRQPDWRVLFANLGDKDGGAIVAQLSTMNVPYKHADGGGAILVPADRVHDVRLRLASQGLPKGSVAGFELMEGASRFGMTQFQERLNFQRGLEGELTRSIQALSSVQSARVHLALPNQNGFFREQQKPSASVLVGLHPGRTLDRAQLAGIVHLVASSVPELAPSAVSVLDDSGQLLSNAPNAAGGVGGVGGAGGDAQQLQYVQQIEQLHTRRIIDILEPVVGRNNVKAQVTAEVDFSQTESTSETHKPNQSAENGAVRSQQIVESSGGAGAGAGASGVPGAASNTPPGASSAPINGQAPQLTAGNGNGNGGAGGASKRESTTNYEVDKTVRVTRNASGAVRRLSAAVVVNYQSAVETAGKPPVSKPLTAQQIEQMTALVRETIGFNKERGDSVNLMNTPFQVEKVDTTELPLWKQPQMVDLARSLAWPLGGVLFGALVLLGFVRPAMKQLGKPAQPVRQLSAVVADEPPRPALPAPVADEGLPQISVEQARLDEARSLAKQNPVAVANIVKTWVNGEVPA